MAEIDLAPSERGSISRLIDAVERLTERLSQPPQPIIAAAPVNWWDVAPQLEGRLGQTMQRMDLYARAPLSIQARQLGDRLELSLFAENGMLIWQRCIFARRA